MNDNTIRRDARDLSTRAGVQPDASHQQRDDAPSQDIERFARALAAPPLANAGAAESSPLLPSPLLSSPLSPPPQGVQSPQAPFDDLRDDLQRMVGQLMVGQDASPSGSRLLRMEINEDLLPGVTVRVFEDAGAWVAEFLCRDESSYVMLAEPAQEMARRLAQTLENDSVWRVVADGLIPSGDWARLVNNSSDGLPSTEMFASSPSPLR